MYIIYFLIAFITSIAGTICGIGGGIIIKPALDYFALDSVDTVNFLSSCSVLAMSCYSVLRNFLLSGKQNVSQKIATPLAFGAAIGGVLGKKVFDILLNNPWLHNLVGAIQSGCLLIATGATLLYMITRDRIKVLHLKSTWSAICVGGILGILSSFLGIGGGPINLVALYYFFGLETNQAAQISLYVIFCSQFMSLITTVVSKSVPDYSNPVLMLMIVGGICGGAIGQKLRGRMSNSKIDVLLKMLLILIMIISTRNMLIY